MTEELFAENAVCIRNEIDWFRQILNRRFQIHAGEAPDCDLIAACPAPDLSRNLGPYADVVRRMEMSEAERLLLVVSFIPHIKPDALDPFFINNQSVQRRFTEFGGVTGISHGGFLPTGETAMFLLAGDDLSARLRFNSLFGSQHFFYTENVLRLNHRNSEEPLLSAALNLTPEYVERLATGRPYHPPFGPEFPAQRITTAYEWNDLVVDPPAWQDIQDIATWSRNEHRLMHEWGLDQRLKPGFRSLFYGPPGTGKTLTACLLGKVLDRSVYRIDLSKVISKYIGETEKNLAALFDHAQHQDWILFFDEADSLFGKRTESRDANDRAANQQVSYLLQRIEDFPGIVILATNLRSNLDDAFARRFQSMIHFAMPGVEQRIRLWEDNFKDKLYPLAKDVDLRRLARDHELSGGSIVNVLRYACLRAVLREPPEIRQQDLVEGIRKELHKEGKFLKSNQ